MAGISTHVLDLTSGLPAAGVAVTLERLETSSDWTGVSAAVTGPDGRVADLAGPAGTRRGVYRLRFASGGYFARTLTRTLYPDVTVTFEIFDDRRHHHVPLLLSPFGYTTYLGS